MKLVYLESPYGGDVLNNIKYARLCMHDCLERGEAPLASHLLYTQPLILNDNVAVERALGINAGFAWAKHAELSAIYTDFGISSGMKSGIEDAKKNNRTIEYRRLFDFADMKQDKRIDALAAAAFHNADEVKASTVCACYYCRRTFSPQEITRWIDKNKTALCPFCKIDSVYGNASGFSVQAKFLELAYKWSEAETL